MSLVKFEVKEDHLKLLKFLQWSQTDTDHLVSINNNDNDDAEDIVLTPFGGDDLMEDIGTIIYGQPEDFDPFDEDTEFGKSKWGEEKEAEMRELFNGLSTALSIVLANQSFETGHFKRKFHDVVWTKYEPKK